jgi:LysM repeat protein
VQVGDSLIKISRRLSIPWQELARANELAYPYFIHPGQVLRMPDATPPEEEMQQVETPPAGRTPGPTPTEASPDSYVVQRGDYLTGVADQFGLDWLALARLNGIEPPYRLFPGQVLKLR